MGVTRDKVTPLLVHLAEKHLHMITRLVPDYSGTEISELLDLDPDMFHRICRYGGISLSKGPKGPRKPKAPSVDYSGFPSRRFVVAGSSPCFVPGGIRREGDKVETHGPVRILIQNGKRV